MNVSAVVIVELAILNTVSGFFSIENVVNLMENLMRKFMCCAVVAVVAFVAGCCTHKCVCPKVAVADQCKCVYCSCAQGEECTCTKEKCEKSGCKCGKSKK